VNIFGINFGRKSESTLDQVLRRLEAAFETGSGVVVTPENCEESPTVQAIVNAISSHIVTLPVHVYRKTMDSAGRESKELLPNHPVEKLLAAPNPWQTPANYWADAGSIIVRYGRFVAVKARGMTGPIRRLVPVNPGSVQLSQDAASLEVTARVTLAGGGQNTYRLSELHYVRGRANDFLNGDSPVMKAREAIGLEIAAQRFGAEFFGNGAMPGLIFEYLEGIKGHLDKAQRDQFVESFQQAYGAKRRFRALVLPPGMKQSDAIRIENDKAQYLETRKLQRNIIAGAFGVPPHLVGDLERGTFSNIEHQSQEFTQKVVLPYIVTFEDAMERDLLTDEDRRSGVVIRFNMDASIRADFKTRQDGLKVQREMGVISANDWREREGMNPIPADQGGDIYWQQGPSGQGATDPQSQEEPDDDDADQR
jgi:HK97 family phage portal protein